MKTIPLTQGKMALIDNKDFDWLNQWKWCAHKSCNTWYALRTTGGIQPVQIPMHRQILGLKYGDGIKSDHKDGDGLNNQRYNLRTCTVAQNGRNRRKQKTKTSSRFKGIYWQKAEGKWHVHIKFNQKEIYIGSFDNEIEAAKAYDKTAQKYFGEFAQLNFPEEKEKEVK